MNCASCGRANRDGACFCRGCGGSLVANQAKPAEPAGARKVVTIVFADVVGSTAPHERLDPESARPFMERYCTAMRGAVESLGGTVGKTGRRVQGRELGRAIAFPKVRRLHHRYERVAACRVMESSE